MRFANIEYLNWMWLVAGVLMLGIVSQIRKVHSLRKLGDPNLVQSLMSHTTRSQELLQLLLYTASLTAMVIALAQPQFGTHTRLIKRRGVDVVVALDVSRSMLARDASSQKTISRIERAKIEIDGLIDRLNEDRIGLIAFAGEAFVQCPLTSDYAAAKLLLRAMHPGNFPVMGTDLSEAFRVAREMFKNAKGGSRSRLLVLVSDGEDHENQFQGALDDLRHDGVAVYTVGIGTQIGEQIPDLQDQFLKKNGKAVISRLNDSLLRSIAQSTQGRYIHSVAGDLGFEIICENLARMQKSDYEARVESVYEEKYQLFTFLSIILLVGASLVPARRTNPTNGRHV